MIKASPPFSFPGRRPVMLLGKEGKDLRRRLHSGWRRDCGASLISRNTPGFIFHQPQRGFLGLRHGCPGGGPGSAAAYKRKKRTYFKAFFHPLENEYLKKNNYRDFFDVWAAKESYVKFTGGGIGEDFGGFSAASEDGLAKEINGIQLRSIPFSPDYSLCLCAKEIQNVSLYYENA